MGILYMVASPIGNLADISKRALEVLAEVSLIACEDTRTSRKLLSYYDIHTKVLSCHAYNELYVFQKTLLPVLQNNQSIAYLSEAGTPGISDPGNIIVEQAFKHGIQVMALPGACAVTSVVSIAGLHGKGFIFEGFLPRKKGQRRKILETCLFSQKACIFFESQYRIVQLLEDIADIDKSRNILIVRELSKIYEEILRDNVENLINMYKVGKKVLKGEFSILAYPIKN